MRASARSGWRALLALLPMLLAACQGIDPTPNDEPISEADRARYVKHRVEDAQAFRVQKRFEAAEHQLHLALVADPDHARANALMARTLHDLGRQSEAVPFASRAQALAPAPPSPPGAPLMADASGVLFVLVPPEADHHDAVGLAGEWQDLQVPQTLARRIRIRLPKAGVTEASPASVHEAEAWLRAQAPRAVISLRVDQARCGESAKDGPFALASLTVVAARSGALPDEPVRVRATDDDPPLPPDCSEAALERALESALALPGVAGALSAPAAATAGGDAWSALAVRALFPVLDVQVAREIAAGRAEASRGGAAPDTAAQIERARKDRAEEMPLAGARGHAELDAEADALEAEVAAERRRRDELLMTLQLDELKQRAPTAEEIAVLRVVPIREPASTGAKLARERAGGRTVEQRSLQAADGSVLARFYFEPDAGEPLLREEDTDLDGAPDRWTAYAAGLPSEVWEDRGVSGHVNAHLQLAVDGVSTERIEIDMSGDGRPERVFHYAHGVLVAGDVDANADGTLDRFERFEAGGGLAARDEDLDGDGQVDVRSEFRDGKLLRREILNPALVESLSQHPAR